MIEIYLFIHPLCSECLASEKRILQMIQTEHKKVQFKFVPLLNLQSFQQFIYAHQLQDVTIAQRNALFEASYSAALDYKTMQLQGKKKGRAFLLKLQEQTCVRKINYSELLVNQIVQDIGGDLPMFHADRASKIVKESFMADQETAKEMKVVKSASAVVFNYSCDRDFGVLIEGHPSNDILHELFKTTEHSCLANYHDINTPVHHSLLNDNSLRLLES